jgi:hypothetical protein
MREVEVRKGKMRTCISMGNEIIRVVDTHLLDLEKVVRFLVYK